MVRTENGRAIAKQLECACDSLRRHLRDAEAIRYGPHEATVCKLDAYKRYLLSRSDQASPLWVHPSVFYREIRERGYAVVSVS